MLGGIEHLDRDVFEQFLLRRQIATFEIARVVDQNMRIAGVAADRGEGCGDEVLPGEIELDDHAVAALIPDRRRQARRIGLAAGRQDDEESLAGELLGDGAADAPADADGQVAVIHRLAMDQLGVAAIRLPFRRGAHDHGDRLALALPPEILGHLGMLPLFAMSVRITRIQLGPPHFCCASARRLDQGPKGRAERPCLRDKPLIVETGSPLRWTCTPSEVVGRSGRDDGAKSGRYGDAR